MSRTGPSGGEQGAATILAMAMIGVLLLIGAAGGVVAAMFAAHRSAQSAADLAALAGAGALAAGRDPCSSAADVAAANRASVTGCEVMGRVVQVSVETEGPHWLGQSQNLTAQARAGPA